MVFVKAEEFDVESNNNISIPYMLNITNVERSTNDVLAIADPVSIFEKYSDLAEVFSERQANTLPAYGNQDLLLETNATFFFGILYNLSRK